MLSGTRHRGLGDMRIAAFSSPWDEAITAPRRHFVRGVVGLVEPPPATTIHVSPCNVAASADDKL